MKVFNENFLKGEFYKFLSNSIKEEEIYPEDSIIIDIGKKFEEDFLKSIIDSKTVKMLFEKYALDMIKNANTIEPCPICGNKKIRFITDLEYKEMVCERSYEDEEEENNGVYLICSVYDNGCGAVSGWRENKRILVWNARNQK